MKRTLIEKGTCIYIYNIKDCFGDNIPNFEIEVGEEILKSDDDYDEYNGKLVADDADVEDAIYEYINIAYPSVRDFMFNIEDC